MVTDAAGNHAEDIAYYPFGGTRQESGSTSVSHTYTGQEKDNETGLYNYNARLYDADLGRFMTTDSIVPDPSNPQSFNRYSYVINNPINLIDPTGHGWLRDRMRVIENWVKNHVDFEGGVGANFGGNTGNSNVNLNFGSLNSTNHGSPPATNSAAGANDTAAHGISINVYNNEGFASANSMYSQLSNALGNYYGYPQKSVQFFDSNGPAYYGGSGSTNSAANLGSNPFSLLDKVLTTGNVIAGVGLGLSTAALIVPTTSAAAPFIAFGGAFVTGIGVGWSTYQYYQGNTSLTQHTVNGGIAAASLTTSFIPAPAGPFFNVLVRALDISNSAVGAFK